MHRSSSSLGPGRRSGSAYHTGLDMKGTNSAPGAIGNGPHSERYHRVVLKCTNHRIRTALNSRREPTPSEKFSRASLSEIKPKGKGRWGFVTLAVASKCEPFFSPNRAVSSCIGQSRPVPLGSITLDFIPIDYYIHIQCNYTG